MHAVDDLSDAIDATRAFLTPARPGLWLRLAVVVLFVSSFGFGAPMVPTGDTGTAPQDQSVEEFEQEWEAETGQEVPWEDVLLVLLVVGIVLFVIWLLYALIAAIMEFVFVESLRSSEVHVRRYFRENVGRGLRLFGFRLVAMLVAASIVLVPTYFAVAGDGGFETPSGATIGAIVLLALGVGLVYSLVTRFTSEFVAPVMLLEDRGVLSAWGRFWPALLGNVWEYVVYLILVWVLGIVVTIAAGFVIGMLGFVLAIPFVILLVLLFVVLGGLAFVPVVLLALLGLALFLLLVALVWVPVETYFQYYALLLLGDTDPELDLIPDQRTAVRGDGGLADDGNEWSTGGDGPADEGGWTSGGDGPTDEESEFDWGTTDDGDDSGWNGDDRDDDRGW